MTDPELAVAVALSRRRIARGIGDDRDRALLYLAGKVTALEAQVPVLTEHEGQVCYCYMGEWYVFVPVSAYAGAL